MKCYPLCQCILSHDGSDKNVYRSSEETYVHCSCSMLLLVILLQNAMYTNYLSSSNLSNLMTTEF